MSRVKIIPGERMSEKSSVLLKFFFRIFILSILLLFILTWLYSTVGSKIANLIFKDQINYKIFEVGNEYSIGLTDKFAVYYDYKISKLCPTHIKWNGYTKSINYKKDEFDVEKLIIRQGCQKKYYYLFTPKRIGKLIITKVVIEDYTGEPVNPVAREEFKRKLEDGGLRKEFNIIVDVHG